MALLGSLVDNFCAATLDTATWNAVNSAGNSGFQAGCRYTFIVQAGATGDATLTTDVAYDLTGSHVHVELIDAGVQETGLETYPIILTENAANQDDALFIVIAAGTVGLYESVAGVPNGLAFPSYNAATMRWWRIREASGTVYYESAPDVRGPWTQRASVVPTVNITALFMKIRTFDYLALTTAKQTAVSNVNYLAPPDVPFPNGALPVGMEIAFGADIYGNQSSWVWTDVTPPDAQSYFMSQEVTTTRGRQDESSDVTPTAADIELDNPNGDFTPDNPMSIYYPNVDLGTPARWWINAGDPRLYLKPVYGSKAQVDSISSLDITNDIDIRIDLHLKSTHPAGWNAVLAGRANNAGPYSWRLEVTPDREIEFFWSTTGTAPANTVESDIEVLPSSARATLRVTMDVDNGAGGHDTRFYIGYDGVNGSFTQIGPTITGAGTTSINNAAADLIIGSPPEISGVFALDANVYRFQLRDGIGGTVIVDADFTAQTSGVPAFVDSTGLAWSIDGDSELSDRWFRAVGTIDSWGPVWPWGDLSSQQDGGLGEGQARTELELAGLLRRLGQGASPLQSPLRRATEVDTALRAYWPMEDDADSTQFASAYPGGTPMTIGGNIQPASNDLLPGSKPLPELGSTSFFSGAVVGSFSGHWRIDFYLYIPSTTPNQVFFMRATGDGTVKTWLIDTSAGNVGVSGLNASGTSITSGAASGVDFFDRWVNVQLVAVQNGADIDWDLTWFPIQYPAHAGWTFGATLASATVGGITAVAWPADADVSDISTGHWSVLDEGGVNFPSNAAMGWVGDTAAQRMIRLTNEQGIMFRLVGDPALTAEMGIQRVATLLELLDDAENADGGILFEQQDAVGLIYRTRASMYNQPPNMTLDALQNQLQNPFRPIRDDQRIRNVVTAERIDGSSLTVEDAASVADVGIYDTSVSLNLFSDTQLPDAAGWLLHQGTWPGMRYPQLTTNLGVAPEVINEWLTVDQGAKVVVENLPPQHPNTDVSVIAEGYSEPISPTTWAPVMNCSPAGVWDVAVLFGDWVPDEYLLRLDTDGSILTEPIDDNDTTLFVTVTDGPYWTSDNAETPMDIVINGERMTVTDIDAPVGDQEFVGAGDAEDVTPTTSFVAPSVNAPASGDLLICAWCNFNAIDTYTLPGGMTIAALTDGTYTSFEDATEVLGSSGATGTRTATFGTSDLWSAMSIVAHGASGTPSVDEFLSGVDTDAGGNAQPVTLTTILPVAEGDWLLALQAWDWDPGNNMSAPSGTGWIAVADSIIANADTSRVRAWAKQITAAEAGIQAVTFGVVGGINDNHARLYAMSGVTGITQEFTVTRSVNGVVRSHAAGSDVRLWFQPVLAR
jgi:hypothetical protein